MSRRIPAHSNIPHRGPGRPQGIAGLWARLYSWACDLLYHRFAWSYDGVSWLVSGGRWGRWRRMILPYLSPEPVLEVGFGPGHLLREGRNAGLQMFGVDRSPQMAARPGAPRTSGSGAASIAVAGGQMLPFTADTFGCVAATFPAPFILEPSTLAECHRVLQAEGRLVILGIWVEAKMGLWRHLPVFYGRPSAAKLAAIMQRIAAAGFAVQSVCLDDGPFVVGGIVAQKVDYEG